MFTIIYRKIVTVIYCFFFLGNMECGMNLHTRRPLKWTAAGLSIFPMSFGPMNLWPSFIERNFQTFWPKLFCEAGDFSWSAKLQFFSDVWRRSALVCLQKWQQRQTWCWMEIQPLLFLLQGIILVDNPGRPQRMVVWLRMKWVFCVHTLSMGAVNFRKQD